ncbi:hypothetical protein GQ53DRAFT_134577 [Thozetella sp. PMI_491]|nr:hypothetical protein GQ53DRAFT_134577 [Thozetella sp. PMI_491]
MNTDDEERRQAETGNHFVFRSTRQRTFKACRTCRQQKARCHDADDPPCRRCRATGRDCIFDIFAPQGKRRLLRQGARGLSEETSNHDNSTSESGQVAPGNTGGAIAKPHSPQAEPDSRLQRWSAEPTEPEDDNGCPQTLSATENAVRPEDLNLLRLNAPLTAVHAMRPASLSIAASSPQSNGLQASSQATTSKSFRNPTVKNTQANVSYGDVVSSGLLSESKARELFHLYMAGGNVFLPLFDTTTDTFEAVRQRSAFCLSAILAVALRADSSRADSSIIAERCLAEAQTLAARTLFSSPPELEDIQGMLVLATYAERNWFAFRHALEMAEDVGLPHCLSKLIEEAQPKNTSRISAVKGKQLARMVRTALVLHNVEREVSSGTGRQPRLPPIEKRLLRRFLENKHSIVFDIRIVSTIEVTQLRARLLQEIDALENITGAVMAKFDSFQKDIDQWFKYWDGVYQDHDINVASFHRASLRLQRDYALIILSSAMISKLGKALGIQDPPVFMTDEMSRIIDITMNTSTQLLVSMSQSESYKWHLQWAPTYSALFAVFPRLRSGYLYYDPIPLIGCLCYRQSQLSRTPWILGTQHILPFFETSPALQQVKYAPSLPGRLGPWKDTGNRIHQTLQPGYKGMNR